MMAKSLFAFKYFLLYIFGVSRSYLLRNPSVRAGEAEPLKGNNIVIIKAVISYAFS